jgi:hypothetical protein
VKLSLVLSAPFLVLAAACGGDAPKSPPPAQPPAPALAKLALASKPNGAVAVVEAKKAGAADACVVSGRVANLVPGFAVFTLMDLSLPYCGEKNKEDGCKTPWDYCCDSADTRTANSLLVEVRDANGKPIAGSLGDLRLLDAVTVAGKLTKDEHGNHVLLATGWFRDARPELPANLRWPQ